FLPALGNAQTEPGRPARLETADLMEFDALSEDRQALVRKAIEVARKSPWMPYVLGGSDPESGFDCSGAIYYVLRKVGLDPPRTSAAQYQWLKENGTLHPVAADASDPKHPSLKNLRPGDLLF